MYHLYDENDLLTIENIEEIKWKTGTSELPVWGIDRTQF